MSSITVAGEVIGAAARHVAMVAIWAILVITLMVVIDTGLRALRHRQGSGLRDQAADREAIARPAITRPMPVKAGSSTPAAAYTAGVALGRAEGAGSSRRAPEHTGY